VDEVDPKLSYVWRAVPSLFLKFDIVEI
jgi:hypothetical protein